MRRSIRCSAPFLLALAICALSGAVASAEELTKPLILPEPTEKAPLTLTWLSTGPVKLLGEGLFAPQCKTGSASGEFTSKRLGRISLTLTACSEAGLPCNSVGAEWEVISIPNADLHLVAFNVGKESVAGLAVKLPKSINIECAGLVVLLGAVIGRTNAVAGKKTKNFTVSFVVKEGKHQEITECERAKEYCLEKEKPKKFLLYAEFGELMPVGYEAQETVTLGKEAAFEF